MAEQLLQAILEIFSLRLLYLIAVWFLLFGYMIHLLIVQVLTQSPIEAVMRTVGLLHIRSVLLAFLAAPLFGAITSWVFAGQGKLFEGQFVLVWYLFIVSFLAGHFFCMTFTGPSCTRMKDLVIGGNVCVGLLGYLVLKALDVITFI